MLSRLVMRSKEVCNAKSVQQTSNIFLTLPPTLRGRKNCSGVLTQKSVDKYTKIVHLSSKLYHMASSLILFSKRTNMWSNALMKHLPCVFQESWFKNHILPDLLDIASSVSSHGHEYQMVCKIFLTPMLKNVLMTIRGNVVCSTITLTHQVPMPQKLQPSKPAVGSLHQGSPPPCPPSPQVPAAPLVDDLNYVESASEGREEVHSYSSLEMPNEGLEVGQST